MLWRTLGFTVAYLLALVVAPSLELAGSGQPGTVHEPFLPSVGVGMVWLLLARTRNELATGSGLLALTTVVGTTLIGIPVLAGALFALASLVVCLTPRLVSQYLLDHPVVPRGRVWSAQSRDPAQLATIADCRRLFFAILPGAVVGYGISVLAELSMGTSPSWMTMADTVLGSWVGIVVVAGPALAMRSARRDDRRPGWVELAALLLVTAMVQWLVFGSGSTLPVGFMSLVLVFWSGLRLSLPLAATHGSVMALSALVLMASTDGGPFASARSSHVESVATQAYMLLVCVLVLLVAAAMGDRHRLVRSLGDSQRRALSKADEAERLFSDSPQGIVLLSTDGQILRANDALGTLLGRPAADLSGRRLRDLSHEDAELLHRYLDRTIAHPDQHVVGDWSFIDPGGGDVHVSFSSRVLAGYEDGADAVLVNMVDLSERRRYEQQLAYLADHDVLTGLANRRRFEQALADHQQRCDRYGARGALLLLDLDHFKEVNDTLGHQAGDQLIVTVAAALRRTFRATDLVARIGGDEFAILLPETDQAGAEAIARDVVDRVAARAATLDGVHRRVTASVGVVTFAAAAQLDSDPIALADLLMYDAKEAGRNQYAVLDEAHARQPRTAARMAWRTRLVRALEEDLFVLHLQPILDLHQNRVTSAEALLRLADGPELVLPGRFVYIAEQNDLSTELDVWVVRRAVAMLARLRQVVPDFVLEVNVSGHSIGDPRLEQAVVESLREHEVDPRALILEVTETAAVADVELARDFARTITQVGARFALDDFGAGFGSFYYLKHLDFDFIKIDGEFVAHVHASTTDEAIVRSIVGIARDLGKQTVAEFVGEPAVLAAVRRLGVDFAQGYLVGRPVPENDFVEQHLGRRG